MEPVFKSLGHEKRLRILDWLKDPEKHFPPQKDGDLVEDGVCGGQEKPGFPLTACGNDRGKDRE